MMEKIVFRLVGDRPLLMHAGRFADPLDPIAIDLSRLTSKRAKTLADYEQISRIEWFGGLWLDDGRPCIPPEAIEGCFVRAARGRRMGKAAQAAFCCHEAAVLEYPGPRDLEGLSRDPAYRLRYPVQVHGSRTMRTRPRFPEWSVVVAAEFLPSIIGRAEVVEIMRLGGATEGVGDWRPRFGKFFAEPI